VDAVDVSTRRVFVDHALHGARSPELRLRIPEGAAERLGPLAEGPRDRLGAPRARDLLGGSDHQARRGRGTAAQPLDEATEIVREHRGRGLLGGGLVAAHLDDEEAR